MKKLYIICLILLSGLAAMAQDFEIVSVEYLPMDGIAIKEKMTEPGNNGRDCAVIRIATKNLTPKQRESFNFDPDWGSKVVQRADRDGEIWLWVTPGLQHLRIKGGKLGQDEVHFMNHGITIQPLKTYKIVIRGTAPMPSFEDNNGSLEPTQQYLVFQITPAHAMLEVDGHLWEVNADGVAKRFVNFGTYNYRVQAPNYHPETNTVVVDDPENAEIVKVNLKPDFVEVTLQVDADAEIWVNDEMKGMHSWKGRLGKGTYKIECKQAGHETTKASKEITAEMNGRTINLVAPKPIFGSLNIESSPEFATIYIDGKEVGKTPKSIPQILIGQHELKLTKEGFADYTERVAITKNERKLVNATLSKGKETQDGLSLSQPYAAPRNSIAVKSFQLLPMDMTASSLEGKRIDRNGQVAALIKVVTPHTDFTFEGGTLGIVDTQQKQGEIWVWVPRGSRKITIMHPKYGVLREYRYPYPVEIESERTYQMVLDAIDSRDEETFTVNGVSFTMKFVEGGTFEMGNNAESDEKPVHNVTLSDYYIGETEVTQALWKAVMGTEPTYAGGWESKYGKGDNYPAYRISWNDIQEFISKLNQKTGRNFRLPTEAEWEYAARGGKESNGYKYAGSNSIGGVAWYGNNSYKTTHVVKKKTPNELGLYDMSGNVGEWCSDWYGSYGSTSQTNPTGPSTGTFRVLRGGSWNNMEVNCRVSDRHYYTLNHGYFNCGFRLVLVP